MKKIFSSSRVVLFGLVLLICSGLAQADGNQNTDVLVFAPIGMQRDVRQVQMRFGEEIVALGDNHAADPATVTCIGYEKAPVGHWQNPKLWVADFPSSLPDGVACTVVPKKITTLSKASVAMPQPWTFNTGGPTLQDFLPDRGATWYDDHLFGAFKTSIPVDPRSLSHLRCDLNGVEYPVRILNGSERELTYHRLWQTHWGGRANAPPLEVTWTIAACGGELIPYSQLVTWTWGKHISSLYGVENSQDDTFNLQTRPMVVQGFQNGLNTEEPYGAFDTWDPIDESTLNNLTCRVADREMPVRILTGAEKDAMLARILKRNQLFTGRPRQRNWTVAQCGTDPWPNHAVGGWIWGEQIKAVNGLSDKGSADYQFRVRPIFFASLDCLQLAPTSGCDHRNVIDVEFSEAISKENADKFALQGSSGKQYRASYDDTKAIRLLQFNGPFVQGESLKAKWPPDFSDVDNRQLQSAEAAVVAELPPFLGMAQNNVSLQMQPHETLYWPIVERKVDGAAQLHSWYFGNDTVATPALLEILDQVKTAEYRNDHSLTEQQFLAPFAQSNLLFKKIPDVVPTMTELDIATSAPQTTFFGVPLKGNGIWLMEADSPVYRATLTAQAKAVEDTIDPTEMLRRQNSLAVVQRTNLNIDAHISAQGASLIWITSLDAGRPVSGARVEIWSYQHKLLATGVSDEQGRALIAQFDAPLDPNLEPDGNPCSSPTYNTRPRLWIVARTNSDLAVMRNDAGISYYGPTKRETLLAHSQGHMILDRTLLRPGETVSVRHVLRQADASGWTIPPAADGKLSIFYSGTYPAVAVAEQTLHWNRDGSANNSWQIPAGAKLGHYYMVAYDANGGDLSWSGFDLEEFRIPQFDADLKLSAVRQGQKQSVVMEPTLTFKTGGRASGQLVRLTGSYSVGVNMYGLHFVDVESSKVVPEFKPTSLQLDKHGYASRQENVPYTTTPMEFDASMGFTDASGEAHTQYAPRLALWPKLHKTGISIDTYALPNTAKITVGVFDEHDQPVVNENVIVDVAESKWRTAGDDKDTGLQILSPRSVVCAVMTDAKGLASCRVERDWKTKADGWLIRAAAKDASPTSLTVGQHEFASTVYVAPPAPPRTYGILEREESKPLKVGDIAHFQVRSPFLPAMLLLTVEREGVLTSQVHFLTHEIEPVDVPVEAVFAPGVTVVASLLRGTAQITAQKAKLSAMTATAQYSMLLDSSTHNLNVSVAPERSATHPSEPVLIHVNVKRADGEPASHGKVTLVAVDEGLLEMHPNSTWALLEKFWYLRPSDVVRNTYKLDLPDPLLMRLGTRPDYQPSIENELLGFTTYFPIGAKLTDESDKKRRNDHFEHYGYRTDRIFRCDSESASTVQMIVADGLKQSGSTLVAVGKQPRINFSTLAHWQTDLVLDENGNGTATITPPDSLTNWRVVAIAEEGVDHFGSGSAQFKTEQPVQIISGMPQTVRSTDTLRQKITVRNTTAKALTLDVTGSAKVAFDPNVSYKAVERNDAGLQLSRQIKLIPGESRVVEWQLTVPVGATRLDWDIAVNPVDGNVDNTDRILVSQAVVPVVPVTVRESELVQVDSKRTISITQPQGAASNAGGVVVSWQASMVDGAVENAREWMRKYPYACMEQRSSKAAVSGDPAQWAEIIGALPKYMDKGLVRYFPGTIGSETLTAYLLDLSEAYHLALPEAEKKEMLASLRRALTYDLYADWAPKQYLVERRLALQAAVAPDLGDAKPFVPEDLNRLPTISLVDWIRYVLKTPESPQRTQQLVEAGSQLRGRYDVQGTRLIWHNERDDNFWWFMWTDDVAVARTALLAQELGAIDASWKDDATGLIRGLVDRQKRGAWATTTSNAWSVAAIQHFETGTERGAVTGSSSVTFGANTQTTAWPKALASHLPWPEQAVQGVLSLEHQGTGAPWATVEILAAIKLPKPISHGVALKKTMTPIERRIKGKWSVGDVIQVELEMTADSDLTWLAVNDPIASGATILDKSFHSRGYVGAQPWWNPSSEERGNDSYRGYYQHIWSGKFVAQYRVRLNNAGKFNFPPTRLEAMYAPEIFAETPNDSLEVGP